MKVKELIEELQKLDKDMEIILSSDEEGNNYSPLDEDYSIGYYIPENTYRGEFIPEGYIREYHEETEYYEGNKSIEQKCIALYPIN